MHLRIKDVVELLHVSEKTVYRWIKEKKIPCYRIQHQYRFNRAEINEWILSNKIDVASNLLDLSTARRAANFSDLLRHGGIYPDIPGHNVREVLHNAVRAIHTPANINKEDILAAILNREEMMSTAIGKGIAIPHPRNPIITEIADTSVSICFLSNPVDFGALDGQPVRTLFILLSYSPRRHLEVLSKVSNLCQLEEFRMMLERSAGAEETIGFIETKEADWRKKEPVVL